jgi:general secretion pathway protein K
MKRLTCRGRLRERGVAVITALLLTTLAITIVASLFWQQQVQVRSIENQRTQLQKQWILRGAIDWARLILRSDAALSRVDTLDEQWSVPLEKTKLDQYVENGAADNDAGDATLSGDIVDAQSRFNLTNLSAGGQVNVKEVAVFGRLLGNLGLNPTLAEAAAKMMARTQRKDDAATATAGAVRSAQQMSLQQFEDLLAVPGFSVEMLGKLRDFIVVLPRATPINVNTASAEILSARLGTLSMAEATSLVASRKQAHFMTTGDVGLRLPGKTLSVNDNEIAVQTSFFLINGNVRLGRAALQVQSLIERNGINTQVIWIREN